MPTPGIREQVTGRVVLRRDENEGEQGKPLWRHAGGGCLISGVCRTRRAESRALVILCVPKRLSGLLSWDDAPRAVMESTMV